MRAKLCPAALLAAMLIAGTASASDTEKLFDLSLEELSQIKVTVAARNDQLLRDTASLVTVFTEADIRRLGVRTLGELLGYVPGMRSYRTSGTSPWVDSYESRGIRDDFNSMLLLMIDGHRLNSPYNGGTAQMTQHSLANAARVEIIRGPGSALYGSNALVGVINIISRNQARQVFVGAGNDGNREAAASGSFTAEEWRGSLHVARQQSDGQHYNDIFDVTGRNDAIRDPYRADEWRAWLAYQQYEFYTRGSRHQLDGFYQVNFVHPDNKTQQETTETGLSANWGGPNESWQLNAQLSHSTIDQESYANRAPAGTPPFFAADWLGGFLIDSTNNTATVDALWHGVERHTFAAGVRHAKERIRQASLYSNYRLTDFTYLGDVQAVNDLLAPSERDASGIYLQDQFRWSADWQSTLGIRYDKYDDFGGATSPRLAVQYQGSERDTFKLMHGRAYRAPASNELYTTGNPVTIGNPDLDPVRSQTTELLWLHESPRWRMEFSAFEQKIRDQILSEFIAPGLREFTNKGELRVRGTELDWLIPLSQQWRARFQATWIADIDEELGDSTGQDSGEHNTPHNWGSAGLSYVADSVSWHLAATYTGDIDLLPEQDGYWLWRSHAIWSLTPQLDLTLTINNLFDEDYVTLTNIAGFGLGDDGNVVRSMPGRGRDCWLRLAWRWP